MWISSIIQTYIYLNLNLLIPILQFEIITHEDIEYIIKFNKRLVERRRQVFEVDRKSLESFFRRMNLYNTIWNRRQRIIKKSGQILAGISYNRSFGEGNKTTALTMTLRYLRRNHYTLPVLLQTKNKQEIYDLITKTVEKFPEDDSIFGEIEEFISNRMIDYT